MVLHRSLYKISAILALLPLTLLAQADRISAQVDATSLRQVVGNISPQATPAFDEGPVDPAMKLNYIQLVLKPSVAQQSQLDQLLIDQQNPGSPDFRKWLTPEQFADRFGVSQGDIGKITGWMRSQGFDIITVARGRRFIAFNATAQQIQSALKTELHHYRVDGELHFANAMEPLVPAAIQPLVLGFMGLDDFQPKSMLSGRAVKPRFTTSNGTHILTPGDLDIIYHVTPIYNSGYTGSGMDIAIIGRTAIKLADIDAFRTSFGLSNNQPQVLLVPGATNPGIVAGDEVESDLDLEYSGGIARDAHVIFVFATNIHVSLSYAIDQALAPVISYSYGQCELDASAAGAGSDQSLAQQANAQGVTWIASAGDAGAAACDQGAKQASHGATVEVESAIPEVTAVGGTMFNENGNPGAYWNTANGTDGSSALGYIPEKVWNESTSDSLAAGGGGYSSFFFRGAWQVGPGVPAGSARGIPDVALAAAGGHDPYFIVTGGQLDTVGGTSAAAPSFAGMIVLLNQYLGTNGLGNINPSLYRMATTTAGVFHDITIGGNFIPCVAGSPNCGPTGYFGYGATPGWDAVSGLGSVDATQMLNQWTSGAVSTTTTVAASPGTFGLNASTQVTATVTSSSNVTPTGVVNFTVGSTAVGTATLSGSGSTATGSLTVYGSQLPVGNDTIEASYGGDNNVNGSNGSVSVSVSVPQQASAVVPSVNPDPVYKEKPDAAGNSWFFTVTLTEVAGASTTLTGFTFNGQDFSSSITNFFGSSAIPANGTLTAVLEDGGLTVPAQVVMGFSGMDPGGRQWNQQITVPFYGPQITAAMQLVGLPDTILEDPVQAANCPWFQNLGLQELNGHPVYLQHFYADGQDLSSQIAYYFGSSTLPPFGALFTGICWDVSGDTLPETLSYEIDGVDDSGNPISTTTQATFKPAAANPGTLATSADSTYDVVQLAVTDPSQSTTGSVNVTVNSGQAWSVSLFPSNRTTKWLTIYPASGTGPATVNLSASGSDLAAGLYQATLVFQSVNALPESIAVTVNFVVGTPQIGAVVNGASLANTGLSPGLIFTVFGAGMGPAMGQTLALDQNGNVAGDLSGVTVFVDNIPAPMLYLGLNQINVVAPYEIAGKVGQSVAVQVDDNGVTSNSFNTKVVATAPAIFSLGNGQGAILNQDGSVNGPGNPAARGSYIQIYGTGEGQLNPSGVDGQIANETIQNLPRPVAPFSLTIGGVSATYSYAGTAPQSFEGFLQVNAQIPAGIGTGNQPVILNIGGATSVPLNVAVK